MVESGWAKVSAQHLPYDCWHYHWRFDPDAANRSERVDGAIGLLSILLVVGAIIFGVSSLSSSSTASGGGSAAAQSRQHTPAASTSKPIPGPLPPPASAP